MSEELHQINVHETRRFGKALSKLPVEQLRIVENEIDKIISNPEIGERKKGDLSYLRVHKFKINKQLALLGYSWIENRLEIILLHLDSHENFYQQMKTKRKTDLKLIGS